LESMVWKQLLTSRKCWLAGWVNKVILGCFSNFLNFAESHCVHDFLQDHYTAERNDKNVIVVPRLQHEFGSGRLEPLPRCFCCLACFSRKGSRPCTGGREMMGNEWLTKKTWTGGSRMPLSPLIPLKTFGLLPRGSFSLLALNKKGKY